MPVKDKKRVGVMRGGVDNNYSASLKRGGEIIFFISKNLGDKYRVIDILIDRGGTWHVGGLPVNPPQLAEKVDMVWNAAHQRFSNILQSFSIPHMGIPPFSPYFGDDSQEMLRKQMKKIGVSMPRSIVLPVYHMDFDGPRKRYAIKKAKEIFEKFPAPWIVRSFPPDSNNMGPVRGREGSQRPSASNGMGIHLAKTFPELVDAIEDGVKHQESILVEEFISGKVASVHSVRGWRKHLPGQHGNIYTFPLGNTFGNFSAEEKEKLGAVAKNLHQHLGAKHYLKSDFILGPRGKIYLLQIETMPDLRPDSHFHQACESVGAEAHQVVEHMLEQTLC